jgi:cell division transport system permease protein
MALKVDYVAREVFINLRRNVTLTVATIVTVVVSLSLVGAALLVRQGNDRATERFQGGIEFIVFVDPEATPEADAAIGDALEESPQVERVTYIDQDEAFEEFKTLFAESPEMIETVSPEILPPSYRVVPRDTEADAITALGETFENRPGVKDVVFAAEAIKDIQEDAAQKQRLYIGIAIFLLVAALLLIVNTIRTAMFARRREIEVMKLVGATNWFIRVPFMIEGVIQGLIGASIAALLVWRLPPFLEGPTDEASALRDFIVVNSDIWGTNIVVLILGVVVGLVGSFVAVTRFLDV